MQADYNLNLHPRTSFLWYNQVTRVSHVLYFLVHLIFSIRIQVYLALKTKLYLLIAHIAKMLWQLSHVFQYVSLIPNVQGSETVPTNRAYMSQESSLTNKDIVNLLQQSGINICFVMC